MSRFAAKSLLRLTLGRAAGLPTGARIACRNVMPSHRPLSWCQRTMLQTVTCWREDRFTSPNRHGNKISAAGTCFPDKQNQSNAVFRTIRITDASEVSPVTSGNGTQRNSFDSSLTVKRSLSRVRNTKRQS